MSSRSRRSSRNRGSNELVDGKRLPGGGNRKDIRKLSQSLGVAESVVVSMMACEGRGIHGENDGGTGTPSTPTKSAGGLPFASPSTSNAWADFIQEEGVNLGAGSTEPASKKRKKGAEKSDDAEDSSVPSASMFGSSKSSGPVEYDLSSITSIINTKKNKKKGLKPAPVASGSLVQAGTMDSTYVGRKNLTSSDIAVYHLTVPSIVLPKIPIMKVCTGCNAAHAIAIDTSNNAYGWGRNEGMVLGSDPYGDDSAETPRTVPTPQIIANDIVDAALGKSHTILLQNDGSLSALGQNKSGQCGWRQGIKESGSIKECSIFLPDGTRATDDSPVFVKVTCGEDFSAAIDSEGRLYTTGSSEYGQLGNGETGETIVTAGKVEFSNCYGFQNRSVFYENDSSGGPGSGSMNDRNTRVVPIQYDVRFQDVAAGKHHCLALEAPSKSSPGTRVFSWGSGSYGCLGHNRQKDEYFPRHVTTLARGTAGTAVAAGSTCSMVLTAQGHVYYWGKHRSNAEAVMQPKIVEALANNDHVVTHVAAGPGSVVCTTNLGNTVVWGAGPYGELGLKDKKSSAKPAFVDALSGLTVSDLACGAGTILYVINDDKTLPTADIEAIEAALKA